MGKFGRFLKMVFSRWEPVMSGVAATFLVWLIGLLYESRYPLQTLPWYWYVLVACFFAFLACYFTWLEQEQRIEQGAKNFQEAQQKITALKDVLAAQFDDMLHELLTGPQSRLTSQGKLAYLQRRVHYLRSELENTTIEDRPILAKKIALLVKQQLDLTPFQRPSTDYGDQFNTVIRELEELRSLVKEEK